MGPHLFLVLTDPDDETRLVVTAVVVTERGHTDKTCILDVGDHPFIRHRSSVDYGSAKFVPLSRLETHITSGVATQAEDIAPEVLGRVRAGLLQSSRTIHAIADYCRVTFRD